MTSSDVSLIISKLDVIIFLLETLCIASSFLGGFVMMQFIIHCKNQHHLF